MLFNLKKFNKEIAELRDLRNQDMLSPESKLRVKQSVVRAISGAAETRPGFRWHVRFHQYIRYAVAIVVGLCFIGGTAFAAGNSKPGDILFPVKKATEAIRIKLATTDAAKAELQTKFAEERLHELSEIDAQMYVTATSSQASQKDIEAVAQAKDKAETEVDNALTTLQQVKVDLEAKGNEQAAKAVEKTIIKLQSRPIEKPQKAKDKKETDEEQSGDGDRGLQSHGSSRIETSLPVRISTTTNGSNVFPKNSEDSHTEKQQTDIVSPSKTVLDSQPDEDNHSSSKTASSSEDTRLKINGGNHRKN